MLCFFVFLIFPAHLLCLEEQRVNQRGREGIQAAEFLGHFTCAFRCGRILKVNAVGCRVCTGQVGWAGANCGSAACGKTFDDRK